MNWSKEWPKPDTKQPTPNPTTDPEGFVESLWSKIAPLAEADKKSDIDFGLMSLYNPNKAKAITETANKILKEYNNKVPTHDPYTNPNAHIYHECACGAILDPGTKSFAALNNAASDAGWKIRWGHEHYIAHCVKCGEGVE